MSSSKALVVPRSPAAPLPPRHEIVLHEESNPSGARTIFSMVTIPMQEAIEKHSFEYPELFHQNEKSLMDAIRGKMGGKPHGIGITENRLRVAFWMEFDRAVESMAPMQMQRVYGGICTREYFHQNYLRYPEKVAWMLCPVVDYVVAMEEALVLSIDKLREVLDMPLYDKGGKPDTKVGELILKIYEKLDLRKHGAILQRIETKNLHAHTQLPSPSSGAGMEDIDERLAELEARAVESGLPPAVKAEGE